MTPAHGIQRKFAAGLAAALLAAGFGLSSITAVAGPLRDRLQALAAERGFELEGLERIGEEPARPAGRRDPAEQINRLLADYNFVIARDAAGHIARLTIVGMRASPEVPQESRAAPSDAGAAEHYADAVLTGPNGRPVPVRVMVDTGASTLVLPRSLAGKLGFGAKQATEVRVQTANGVTGGMLTSLQSVRVGEAEARDVAVTFVEDGQLGGKQLLGMSFLGRFRMTFDGRTGALEFESRRN